MTDSKQSNSAEFAKTFLDLWQEQLNSALTDPAAMTAMMAMWRQFQENMAKNQPPQGAAVPPWGTAYDPFAAAGAHSPHYSPHAATGHAGYGVLVELSGRLAACEARIAQLEQALAAQSQRPAARKPAPGRKRGAAKGA